MSDHTSPALPDPDAPADTVPELDISLARIAAALHEIAVAQWAAVKVLDQRLQWLAEHTETIGERV